MDVVFPPLHITKKTIIAQKIKKTVLSFFIGRLQIFIIGMSSGSEIDTSNDIYCNNADNSPALATFLCISLMTIGQFFHIQEAIRGRF